MIPVSPVFGDALPELRTSRLRLRHPRPEDVDDVFAIFGDPSAMAYWSHEPLASREAAVGYLQRIDRGFEERALFQWAVTARDDPEDRMVGTVTLYDWDRVHRRAGLGYMLRPACWGRGLATEAARAVVAFGFERMDLHRLEADTHPDNLASQRVLGRLGFLPEGRQLQRWFVGGEWSDGVLFGLLRSQFPAPDQQG